MKSRPRRRCRVVIAGGGTAGHVLPGLAIAQALVDRGVVEGSDDVHFVGSRRGIERTLVPTAGFPLTLLPGRGIQRRLAVANVGAILGLGLAGLRAVALLVRHRPAAVVALGGYASVPCGIAAVLLRIPMVVAEQNAVPGAANRLLGRFARACAVPAEGTGLPRAVVTGNPVRAEVRERAAGAGRESARADHGLDDRPFVVVFGGSLGARRINQAVFEAMREWDGEQIVVHHVLGSRDWNDPTFVRHAAAPSVAHHVVEYEHDLPTALAAADLVLCRSGATTVAELGVIGVPSLLMPLPGAPGDHQTANARLLADVGGAVLLPDAEIDGGRLRTELSLLLGDAGRRRAMALAAAGVGIPDAADRVADLVEEHARG